MNPDLSEKAINKLEFLCGLGCTQVNQILKKASNGNQLEELSGFSHTEAQLIVDELGKIMSIYDTSDTDNCAGNSEFK